MSISNISDNKSSKSTIIFVVVSLICLAIMAYFVFTTGSSSTPPSLGKMQHMTQKVQGMETEATKKQAEIIQLVDQYNNKPGKKLLALDTMELTNAERHQLEQLIDQEKDVSARTLLKEILQRKEQITDLKEKITSIEDQLPAPYIAQKGDSHYGIALTYLVEQKGLTKAEAEKTIARVALFEELAEGFKIWNFYNGAEYGTSVTQGDAKVSPNVFVHRAKKALLDDRDKALSERDKLAENIKTVEEKQRQTDAQVALLNNENQSLTSRVSELNEKVNSLFYRLDSKSNLKKKGIIKSGFLKSAKLKDVSPKQFNRSLDLNIDDQLVISAADLGVEKIKDVVLYPRFYKKNKNYKVLITTNKKHALLTLLSKEQFKSERVVIAVN